jgi:hypothetical protein
MRLRVLRRVIIRIYYLFDFFGLKWEGADGLEQVFHGTGWAFSVEWA